MKKKKKFRSKSASSIKLPPLKRGDVIQYHNKDDDGTVWNWFYWTHTMMYIGRGKIIHSAGRGVEIVDLKEKLEKEGSGLDNIAILRVKKEYNVDIDKVINFAKDKIGRRYDMWSLYLITKQRDFPFRPFHGYYCTELIWAAYLAEGGINLDKNIIGWVRPIDIYGSDLLDRVYVRDPDAVIVPGFHLYDMLSSDEDEEDGNIYHAKTRDGWEIGIKRYLPQTDKVSDFPVVLCHGLASNKNSCDFGKENSKDWLQYSLAAYLSKGQADGVSFDVWVPELRGRGKSKTFDPVEYPGQYDWCLDEYVDFDIPAILECIENVYKKEKGETRRVFWIGKSMGGMLAYAYGIRGEGDKKFKGVVAIGSPVKFGRSAEILRFIPTGFIYGLAGPFHIFELLTMLDNKPLDFILSHLAKKKNIEPRIFESYLRKGFNNTLSSKVLKQFAIFKKHNNFCRYPRYPWLYDSFDSPLLSKRFPFLRNFFAPFSYTKNLAKFQSPLFVVIGAGDETAHHDDVKYAFDHVGSRDKSVILFAENAVDENGKIFSSYDYGHLDLNIGIKAKDEVYPKIYEWLVKRI